MAITGRSHRYKNSTHRQHELVDRYRKINYWNVNGYFSFYVYFLYSFTDITFTGIDYDWQQKQERFTLREKMGGHPSIWWVPCCSSFFFNLPCGFLFFISDVLGLFLVSYVAYVSRLFILDCPLSFKVFQIILYW